MVYSLYLVYIVYISFYKKIHFKNVKFDVKLENNYDLRINYNIDINVLSFL